MSREVVKRGVNAGSVIRDSISVAMTSKNRNASSTDRDAYSVELLYELYQGPTPGYRGVGIIGLLVGFPVDQSESLELRSHALYFCRIF